MTRLSAEINSKGMNNLQDGIKTRFCTRRESLVQAFISETQERERAIIKVSLRLIEHGGFSAFKPDAPTPCDCAAFDKYVCGGCKYDAGRHCKDSR